MNIWVLDPKTKKPSVSLSLFLLGFFVAAFKLAISGLTLYGLSFESFSGTDFAAVVGALGAIYGFRKHTDKKQEVSPDTSGDEEGGI